MNFCSKLGLGTVQWGMRYGIANRFGRSEAGEVAQMLRLARKSGITLLDTAHVYGDAESVIGQSGEGLHGWRIVTKTLPGQRAEFGDRDATALTDAFHRSLERLNCSRVFGLLVHDTVSLLSHDGDRLWDVLQDLKSQALVSKIGVSVYDPDELDRVLDSYPIDLVQLPLNLYDQRFLHTGLLDRLKFLGIEVHSRSAFLQGLLLMPPDHLPEQFSTVRGHHLRLHRECNMAGITPVQASLHFCLDQSIVDQVIVGCETRSQLDEILGAIGGDGRRLQDPELFALDDEAVINPRRWTRSAAS